MIYVSLYMDKNSLDNKTFEMLNIISKNVKKYRKQKGFSQLSLAIEIGLTGNAFIARAENRVKNAHFNIEHIVKISQVLKVDIKEFFND